MKANDLCRFMISGAIILFFGISVWIHLTRIYDDRIYLVFDVVSVWLMILIVFWLFVVEEFSKENHQD